MNDSRQHYRALGVHLFTASGVIAGVLALQAVWAHNPRMAFFWMMIAVFIDSVDGTFARRWKVTQHAPEIDGRRLDDMVDYFTWVIVPILALVEWGLLPPLVWAVPLICSALGMANEQAKTDDDYFLGFPSTWNVVALYVWHWQFPLAINAGIVLTLALCVLLPIRFIYPSKTATARRFNVALTFVWGVLVVLSLVGQGQWAEQCFRLSSLYPIYYLGFSLWLHARTAKEPRHGA